MNKIKQFFTQIQLALSKSGLGYIASRVPSMMFWSTISTGLLIGAQLLYFNLLPADYFFNYKSPAHVSDVELGKKPVLDYCRTSNGDYPIVVDAQIRKVEPPVYVQQYQVQSNLPKGSGCLSREIAQKPSAPGEYKVFYTVEVTLPFGVKKYTNFYTDAFTVKTPTNIYGGYSLTVLETDGTIDGKAVYSPGNNLEYAFKGTVGVDYFGTTERHLICNDKDYFIDSYSGRTEAGDKDSVNKTVTVPTDIYGVCRLELRITATVGDAKTAITQVLRSNDFVVQ